MNYTGTLYSQAKCEKAAVVWRYLGQVSAGTAGAVLESEAFEEISNRVICVIDKHRFNFANSVKAF